MALLADFEAKQRGRRCQSKAKLMKMCVRALKAFVTANRLNKLLVTHRCLYADILLAISSHLMIRHLIRYHDAYMILNVHI